jgi:hypothetical protein
VLTPDLIRGMAWRRGQAASPEESKSPSVAHSGDSSPRGGEFEGQYGAAYGTPMVSANRSSIAFQDRWSVGAWYLMPGML